MMGQMDFAQFREEVHQCLGIALNGYKENQMKRRIDSLMLGTGVSDYGNYLNLLQSDPVEKDRFVNKITINVSEFFRNPDIFSQLENGILPELVRHKHRIKIWSAACSNGAEPYSVAIMMQDHMPETKFSITATDIDAAVLKAAEDGIYDEKMLRNVSPERMKKYFIKISEGKYRVVPELKDAVAFRRHNLLEDSYASRYDLIICRNVTIYFTKEAQHEMYSKFYACLFPGGVLFVGAAETIFEYRELGFEKVSNWFYRKPFVAKG